MRRGIASAALVAALTFVVLPHPAVARAPGHPAAIGVTPVATGLAWPAGFTFAPDGRIFYNERFTGEVRIFNPSNGMNTLFATIPNLSTQGEQGLLGIALDPNYATTRPFVYVYATRNTQNGLHNQVIRLRDNGGVGTSPKVILTVSTTAVGSSSARMGSSTPWWARPTTRATPRTTTTTRGRSSGWTAPGTLRRGTRTGPA